MPDQDSRGIALLYLLLLDEDLRARFIEMIERTNEDLTKTIRMILGEREGE